MGSLRFVRAEDRQFRPVSDFPSDDIRDAHADDIGMAGTFFIHHPGGPNALQLLEVRYPAGASVPAHAHDVDEVVVVTEGELRFGRRRCGAGASVLIPRQTLYSFSAGPEGVTVLNFRPRRDTTVLSAADLAAMRRAQQSDQG